MTKNEPTDFSIDDIVPLLQMAIEEDVGTGDATTLSLIPEDTLATAYFTTRQDCVCCGLPVVTKLFSMLDSYVEVIPQVHDGDLCLKGARLATVTGPARAILTGERTALNFLQRLSGVATITRRYVDALGKSETKLLDTRKTTPGYRQLEKYAVRMGGGCNHRMGLYDRVMIKDNHRELAKIYGDDSIEVSIRLAKEAYPDLLVEVEADSLEDVRHAVVGKADIILLDNMTNKEMTEAIRLIGGTAKTEASGGITLERLPSLGRLGLDFISVGALTHSAPSIDIALDM